jgi:4-amino-4-deoxy-L-arabinose transferase-like glycosyltransferase
MLDGKSGAVQVQIAALTRDETGWALSRGFIGLVLVSAAFLTFWSFVVPIFETPDEPDHWQYARFVNQNHCLPVYGSSFVEANSPPLYYLLIAPLAVRTELPPISYRQEHGDFSLAFPPRHFRNATGDFRRYWPIREARLLTVLMSVLSVAFCYLAGLEASGKHLTGLLVGGLVAFWPQFTFRGMSVSNDALVATLSAITIYLVVRLIRRGFSWTVGTLAAIAISGAFLSKVNACFLPVPFMIALLSERATRRRRFIRLVALGAIMLLIVAPWMIRNQHLYGDPLAQKAMLTVVSQYVRINPLSSEYFLIRFPLLLTISSIGDFGWMNLLLPMWAYLLYASALALGALCCIKAVIRHCIAPRLSLVLITTFILNLVVVIYINLTFEQPQGRYMLPSVPAVALLVGLGLESVKRWSASSTLAAVSLLAVSNVLILLAVVLPAYWPPVDK